MKQTTIENLLLNVTVSQFVIYRAF